MFTCQFGRYRYTRLPSGVALAVDMFQSKIDEVFNDMPNVLSIADILVVGYEDDVRDHNETVQKALQ